MEVRYVRLAVILMVLIITIEIILSPRL
jgi:hypothetical protein